VVEDSLPRPRRQNLKRNSRAEQTRELLYTLQARFRSDKRKEGRARRSIWIRPKYWQSEVRQMDSRAMAKRVMAKPRDIFNKLHVDFDSSR
jgi:hypothetical protein